MEIKEFSEIKQEEHIVSEEELQNEYDFYIANQIMNKMLSKKLITKDEYKKLYLLNLESFKPIEKGLI